MPGKTFPKVKVAVSQHEPAWQDLAAGVEKTVQLIDEAASNGAKLIAFSELWIPGYPHWLWSNRPSDYYDTWAVYMANSLEVDGPEMAKIRLAARRNGVFVSLGFSERVKNGSSLYMSTAFIGDKGELISHRRKFKPTAYERVLFGDMTGDSLNNVDETPFGRVGSLECWEHIQPLLKYHTYAQNEHIHIAQWPSLFPPTADGHEAWSFSADAATNVSRLYAIEGGAFVLMATTVLSVAGANAWKLQAPEVAAGQPDGSYMSLPGGGASRIFGPDGRQLAEPLPPSQEGFLYADLDLADIDKAKRFADPVGHYSRPDLFQLSINKKVCTHVAEVGMPAATSASAAYPSIESIVAEADLVKDEPVAAAPVKSMKLTNGHANGLTNGFSAKANDITP